MKIVTEPRVYLVGRTQIDESVVQQFLSDEDTEWFTDSENGSELISELAGRVCFDESTEVLTTEGWKLFRELTVDDAVATLNPENHALEFQVPSARHEYELDGELLTAEGRDVSLAVTPEHRQFGHFKGEHYSFVRTDDLAASGRHFAIVSAPSNWAGVMPDVVEMPAIEYHQPLSNQYGSYGTSTRIRPPIIARTLDEKQALIKLIVYFATEGSCARDSRGGQGIVIYGDHETDVVLACRTLSLPCRTYTDPRNGVKQMHVGGGQVVREYFERECGSRADRKRLPTWVLNLPRNELQMVWHLLVATDGHVYASGREVLCTTSTVLAGQAQEILAKLGFSSAAATQNCGTNSPMLVVSRKAGRNIVLNKHVKFERSAYRGKVYCVTTENGIVYVRRNGKVHFSGNCYMSFGERQGRRSNRQYLENIIKMEHGSVLEHVVWNFIITGVSRSFSHELVRHRAGWAYSQLSQRYVDESTSDFVEPQVIASDPELHAIWIDAITQAHHAYAQLSEGLAAKIEREHPEWKVRDKRKKAREAARSVLPNATETKIFMSANARALRHFVEYRGAVDAEPEIRRVALAVLEVMRVEAPALFGDYEIDTLNGTKAARTEHRKV